MHELEVQGGNSAWNEGAEDSFSPETVLALLLDTRCRRIVMSTIESGKMVDEIRAQTGIPLSTCYRKVAELVKRHVLVVERMVMTPAGKKYATYRSAIAGIRVEISHGKMDVSLTPNGEATGRPRITRLADQLGH